MSGTLERGAGLLLPISSLPSDYGIGVLGQEARDFVDFLADCGQKYWQVLPVGPTGYGDSPYQSFSVFMGNPYFIDLKQLAEEELLTEEELETPVWGEKPDSVSYECLYRERFPLLRLAAARYWEEVRRGQREPLPLPDFAEEPAGRRRLEDYCLYMALKDYFEEAAWSEWPEDIRRREPEALERYGRLLQEETAFWRFCQIQFFRQWKGLKKYANEKGIRIIGDLPIYVAADSVDLWASPELFQLDEELIPTGVAGVPPDMFSETGQLWGNPLYDWEAMAEDGFTWWRERVSCSAALFDVLRIDHFIGMCRYYTVPYGAPDARDGYYRKGPGQALTAVINEAAGDAVIVAEDLGVPFSGVKELLRENGYPNMKILEFGFDGGPDNEHAPHNYERNCLVYVGTHDNETLAGFLEQKQDWELSYGYAYFGVSDRDALRDAMLRAAYSSVAQVTITQVQDVLGLGNEARMNFPGTLGENWRWRLLPGQLGEREKRLLTQYARIYGRWSGD